MVRSSSPCSLPNTSGGSRRIGTAVPRTRIGKGRTAAAPEAAQHEYAGQDAAPVAGGRPRSVRDRRGVSHDKSHLMQWRSE